MRIIGHLCVKNEADRYLERSLAWHSQFLDGIHIFDDSSTDNTVEIAQAAGAVVARPDSGDPTFVKDESLFRAAGWYKLGRDMAPEDGDWILALDADEFFHSWEGDERESLERAILTTDLLRDVHGVDFRVDEVFDVMNGTPLTRIDGYWGSIHAVRLVRWMPEWEFKPKHMGGGSVPSYVEHSYDARNQPYGLVHFGYARQEDREEKYKRYAHPSSGHSSKHVESILRRPSFAPIQLKDGVG